MRFPRMIRAFLLLSLLATASAVFAQENAESSRDKTRVRMNALLERVGPDIKVKFQPSSKSQYVFTGVLRDGLTHSEYFEIVITVTSKHTISFRVYPHYKGGYINIDKVRNPSSLMRMLLRYSDMNFLYWGADESGDIFAGYNFTLESGFPEASIRVVLNSIANLDKFVGDIKQVY